MNDSWFKQASDFSSHVRAANEHLNQRELQREQAQRGDVGGGGDYPKNSSGILEKMYEDMEARAFEKWKSRDPYDLRFHSSQLYEFCPRRWALLMRGKHVLVPERNTYEEILVFEHGHAVHDRFQNRLLAFSGILKGTWKNLSTGEIRVGKCPDTSGKWQYQEEKVVIRVPGLPDEEAWGIIGRIDADFGDDFSGDLGDLKSCSPDIYKWLERAYYRLADVSDWFECMGEDIGWADYYARQHSFQLTLYMHAKGRKRGWCMYIPKAKVQPPIKEFLVPYREAIVEAAFKKVRQTHVAWNGGDWNGKLPDRPCKSISCELAQECPVASECFKAKG